MKSLIYFCEDIKPQKMKYETLEELENAYKKMEIFGDQEFCEQHFRKYPVIRLDLKCLLESNMEEFLNSMVVLLKANFDDLQRKYEID